MNTPNKQSKGFNLSEFMSVFDGSKSTYAQSEMSTLTQPTNPRNSKGPNGTATDSRASYEEEDIEGERESRMWLDGADDDFDADEHAFNRSHDDLSEELSDDLGDGDSYRDRPIVTSPGQLDGSNSSSVQPIKASPSELYQSCIDNLDYIESASMVSNTTAASSARSGTSDQFAAGPNDDGLYTLLYYVGPPLPRFLETTCKCRLPLVCSEHLEDWRTYLTTRPDSPLSGWTIFYRRIRDRHRRGRKRMLDFLRMKSNSYRHLRRSIADIQIGALTIEELSPQEYEILMNEKFEDIQYHSFKNDAQLQESEIMQEKKARVYEQTKWLQELMLKAMELGKDKLSQDEKAELRYLQRRCAKRSRLEWNNGYEMARIHARQGKLVLD